MNLRIEFKEPTTSERMGLAGMSDKALIAYGIGNTELTIIVDYESDQMFIQVYTDDNVAHFEGLTAMKLLAQINEYCDEVDVQGFRNASFLYDVNQFGY